MELNSIFSIFDKYGWAGLICVVLVVILVYLFKNFSKENQKSLNDGFEKMSTKLSDTIAEQNKTLIAGLQEQNVELVKHILKDHTDNIKTVHNNSINQRKYIDNEINDRLKNLFYLSRSSRVAILEFHNSKENLSGLSFLWYDMHYERQSKSTSSISAVIKDRQASALLPIVDDLANIPTHTKAYSREDIENIYERSSVLYDDLINKLNVNSIIYSAIYNQDNNTIMGLLVVEYLKEPDPDLIKEVLNEVPAYSVGLGTALTYHRKLPIEENEE